MLGVLNLHHSTRPDAFSDADLEFTEQLAHLDAKIIARAQEHEALRTQAARYAAVREVRALLGGEDAAGRPAAPALRLRRAARRARHRERLPARSRAARPQARGQLARGRRAGRRVPRPARPGRRRRGGASGDSRASCAAPDGVARLRGAAAGGGRHAGGRALDPGRRAGADARARGRGDAARGRRRRRRGDRRRPARGAHRDARHQGGRDQRDGPAHDRGHRPGRGAAPRHLLRRHGARGRPRDPAPPATRRPGAS